MIIPKLDYYDMGADVTAFSTTRHGGCSTGSYTEFNINRYCGDTEVCIRKNREALCLLLGINDDRLLMPPSGTSDENGANRRGVAIVVRREKTRGIGRLRRIDDRFTRRVHRCIYCRLHPDSALRRSSLRHLRHPRRVAWHRSTYRGESHRRYEGHLRHPPL